MSGLGQTEKYSARAIVFRSPPKADMPAVGSSFQIQHESGDRCIDLKLDFDSIKMESLFKMNTINLASRIA
jgi:hypothetical protein